jgi:hypothetical protein
MKLADFKMNSQPELHTMKRVVLDFGKYHLSVITGGIGNTEAPYEIAVLNSKDGVARGFVQLPGITGPDDDVRGHMTEEDVDAVLVKLYTITGEEPQQI